MKSCFLLARISAWAFVLVLCIPGLSVPAQSVAKDGLRRLYEDKERLAMFSSGFRNVLEARFGARGEVMKEERLVQSPDFWTSPMAGPLVNDPASDTTARDTQSETSIALGAGSTVIASFNDSGSSVNGAAHFTGYAVSLDGGVTWSDRGTFPASSEGDAGDPVLAHGPAVGALPETIYQSTLGFNTMDRIQVFRSYDNGQTFQSPVNATPGFIGSGDVMDKEWMAVDSHPGGGQGNVYVVWRHFSSNPPGAGIPYGIRFTRSTDGGASWGPNQGLLIASQGAYNVQGAFVTVGPDHAVYVFWLDQSAGWGAPNVIKMRKSTNQGTSFGAAVTVSSLLGTGVNGDLGLFGGFRTASFPQAAVNPVTGAIYVTFNDRTSGSDRADIFFVQSNDGGATWSPRQRVNDDSTPHDQVFPALAVTPDGTRLFIGFYDRRLDAGNLWLDTFGVIATVSGSAVSFGRNFRITQSSFPVVVGQDPAVGATYMGDYDQAVADNNYFYYTWGDNSRPSLAHAHQPDIRCAKIPVTGPGAVLRVASVTLGGGNGNGVIDINECNELAVVLQNLGTEPATGIAATLTASTAGISVIQGSSSFPDLPAGSSGGNHSLLRIETAPGMVCGSQLDFLLTVTVAGQGTFVLPWQRVGSETGPVTIAATDVPKPIVDLNTISSMSIVSGIQGSIAKIRVKVFLTHTWDSDLILSLTGPDGTTVQLSDQNGNDGDNYGLNCLFPTIFDDAASGPISSAIPPFAGSFRPKQALSAFKGKSGAAVNGPWTLRVQDLYSGDAGSLECWGLEVTTLDCMEGGGPCLASAVFTLVAGPNFLSSPFHQAPSFRGTVGSVAQASISVLGNPGWAADGFGPRDGFSQYILVLRTDGSSNPGNQGDWWWITGNSDSILLVDSRGDDLSNLLGAGDEIEVRRLNSLADLFGTGPSLFLTMDSDGSPDPSGEDVIYFVSGTSFYREVFYHDGSLVPAGYYVDGNGPFDGSTLTLNPDEPIMLFRKLGTPHTPLVFSGAPQITRLTHYLKPGPNAVATGFAMDAPIGSSGLLEAGWRFDADGSASSLDEDILYTVHGTSFMDEVFYHDGSLVPAGWYANGAADGTFPLPAGRGFVIFVSNPTGLRWRQWVPF